MAAALWPARRSAGQGVALEDFQGEYAFVGGEREERRLDAAIDAVVDQMNIFVREIARGRIHGQVRPEGRVRIEVVGAHHVRFELDGWGPHVVSLDGRERRVRGPDESDTRLSARFHGGRLHVRQVSPQGERRSSMALAGDRERMRMSVRIRSARLPDDIRYALTYRKR